MPKKMTVREAANALGVSIRRVMTLIAENRLAGAEKNEFGFWLIPVASVQAYGRRALEVRGARKPRSRPVNERSSPNCSAVVAAILFLLVTLTPSAWCRSTTTVTGPQVQDGNGNPYFPGTVSARIILNSGPQPPAGAIVATGAIPSAPGGNGTIDTGDAPSLLAPQPIIAKVGTSITYTTRCTFASTGCSTVPQYTVFAKTFF